MNTQTALLQFIEDHNLRKNNLVVFDAIIFVQKKSETSQVSSQVQIITLPKEMALYIFEFFDEKYNMIDMFSTAKFSFIYEKGKPLEITSQQFSEELALKISPLAQQ